MPAINLAQLSKLFKKGGIAEQLVVWGLLQQLLQTVLGPELLMLQRGVNEALQATPLTPADLADMVNRSIISEADASAYAKQSGVSPSDFLRLVQAAGDGISPQEAVTALRRGLIPRTGRGPDAISLEQAIAESRIRSKWTPTIEGLGAQPLPVADAVDAVVESQIEYEAGRLWAQQSGVDEGVFAILVNTRGNPPSPTELNVLLKRGLIPLEGTGPDMLSVQQGIAEGATKNKWWRLLAALAEYVPPPRTVTALVREGSIPDDQAVTLLQQAGLSQELATAYLHSAHHQKLAATKELAKADIEKMYQDQLLTREDAAAALGQLGWTAHEQDLILSLVDVRRAVAAQQQAIGRVHNLYVNRKLDKATAVTALDALHVPPGQRDALLADWDIERGANVKVLTAAEIASAFFYRIIDQDTAIGELVGIGYTAADAWILLSVRAHKPLPNPPPGVTVPAGAAG